MEAGSRAVSSLELTGLSELYLRPVADFLQGAAVAEEDDVLVALYRVAPGLERNPATHHQVGRCVNLCRAGVRLKHLLGAEPRSGPPSYEPRLAASSGEAAVQGERTAEQERLRLGAGNAPIADLPDTIASQGIWASAIEPSPRLPC